MASVELTNIEHLTNETDRLKQELNLAKRKYYSQQLAEINGEIEKLNETIIPLEQERQKLHSDMFDIKKTMMENCEHELVDHRNFDGHRTYSFYKCRLCDFSDTFSGKFKIMERVYDY